MVIGREFNSRVRLKTRWIKWTTWWQKKNENNKDSQKGQVTHKKILINYMNKSTKCNSWFLNLHFKIFLMYYTVCFINLGKLNLLMVVRFKAQAIFFYWPSPLKKWSLFQKWSKLTLKWSSSYFDLNSWNSMYQTSRNVLSLKVSQMIEHNLLWRLL
jgi:hypothetical protein